MSVFSGISVAYKSVISYGNTCNISKAVIIEFVCLILFYAVAVYISTANDIIENTVHIVIVYRDNTADIRYLCTVCILIIVISRSNIICIRNSSEEISVIVCIACTGAVCIIR